MCTKNVHKRSVSYCYVYASLTDVLQMLEYYESHLVFTNNADDTLNGDEGDDVVMKGY